MGILTPIQKATQEALKKPIVPVVPATPVSNLDAIQLGIDQAKKTLAGIQAQVPSAINSASLAPATNLANQITTPTTIPAPVAPVAPIAPTPPTTAPIQPTAQQTQAQDWTTRLQTLNDQLVGKSAYQTQQEEAQGIPALQKTQNDLSVQLTQLANEAKAIPIQFQGLAQTAGVNQPSLQRQESYQLRDNAIKALTLNSLLASSQGNLAYAQSLADKAVAAQYDPITEEIKAKTANIKLILNSPDATIAEKNRAQAQLDKQTQQKAQVEADKTAQTDILKLANNAISNGLIDANILSQIQNAKDSNGRPSLALAQQILAQTGFAVKPIVPKTDTTKTIDYNNATQFLTDNPNASYEGLFNSILQYTKLTSTEANAFLASQGKSKTTTSIVDKMKTSFQQAKDLGFTRQQILDRFKIDNRIDMPANLRVEFDKIFPPEEKTTEETAHWWEFWKWGQ